MAYYRIRVEVWCDWDPEASELEEIVENIRPVMRFARGDQVP